MSNFRNVTFGLKIKFRGHGVSNKDILVDLGKTEAVVDLKTPCYMSMIHSFLGLAMYYQNFIEWFSKIASHLT